MARRCFGFLNGCTCGPCMDRYFREYSNSCTYGAPAVPIEPEDDRTRQGYKVG